MRLVRFYEDKLYKVNEKGQLDGEGSFSNDNLDDLSTISDMESDNDVGISSCECARAYQPSTNTVPLTSTPVKSQIVIMSSQEMPPSSDESKTVDVVGFDVSKNPFGDMNVEDIPIQIVDDLNDLTGDDDVKVTEVQAPPVCLFCPLSDEDHVCAAMKFSLVISPKSHPVRNFGVGKEMASPPTILIRAVGNGACLFNAFSLLLCG